MNPYVSVILENSLPVLATAIGVLLTAIIPLLALKLKQKFGLDIAAAQQAALIDALDHGIGLAEQWALTKTKTGQPVPSGAEKLDKALEFAIELAKKNGLEALAKEELTKLLEARLGTAAIKSE